MSIQLLHLTTASVCDSLVHCHTGFGHSAAELLNKTLVSVLPYRDTCV